LIIKISSGFFCEEWANAASTAHSLGSSIFCGMVITCKGETVVAAETEQNLENLDKLEIKYEEEFHLPIKRIILFQ
jgi:hypothetical protein